MSADGRFVIVLQARTGSTRLPGKMTREFHDGRTILEVMLDELSATFGVDRIVVATSTSPEDSAIVELANRCNVRVSRGSETDVLLRFVDAIKNENVDWVVRICADNPFLRAPFVRELLDACRADDDYVTFALPDSTPVILSHLGLFAEVIARSTLERIHSVATSSRHREHLTSHILDNSSQYRRNLLPIPAYVRENDYLRLTVDTADDFEVCEELYADVVAAHGPRFTAEELVSSISAKPQLHQRMAESIAANEKR